MLAFGISMLSGLQAEITTSIPDSRMPILTFHFSGIGISDLISSERVNVTHLSCKFLFCLFILFVLPLQLW